RHPTSPTARPGAKWTRRAIDRLIELERLTWQPGRQHFRSTLGGGDIATPERTDPLLLAPAAAGLLVASADRALQHLRTVLLEANPALDCLCPTDWLAYQTTWRVAAATQLDDEVVRATQWVALMESAADGAMPPGVAGARLDAACFAATGLRLATGVGIDEDWVRLRPWLPPMHEHLVLRGLHADGARLDLELTAREGPPQADETGEAAMLSAPAAKRVRVRLCLAAAINNRPRAVVLLGGGAQYVSELRPGDVLERSLPR
ncbi:MAG: hypothetical protein ABIP94_09025, partial [Planctomycetota bacterium]